MIMVMILIMMMIMIIMHIACFIRLSDGEVEVLPNAVKSYGAISEKVSTRMIKNSFVWKSNLAVISLHKLSLMTKPSSRMALGWPFLQLIPRQYFLTGPWWLEVMGSCSSTRWDIIFYQCVWYGLPDRTDLSPITIWLVKSIEWKLTIVTMNISPFDHLKNNLTQQSGEKSNKCYQCDYASSDASTLRTHLKKHRGKRPNKCNHASSEAGAMRS